VIDLGRAEQRDGASLRDDRNEGVPGSSLGVALLISRGFACGGSRARLPEGTCGLPTRHAPNDHRLRSYDPVTFFLRPKDQVDVRAQEERSWLSPN
jgi:hypothetical protein